MDDYEQAIADYTQAALLKPDHVLTYNNRGLAYYKNEEYDRAIVDFNLAIRLDPRYATAYYNRGLVYEAQNDYERSISDFKKCLELAPSSSLQQKAREKIADIEALMEGR